MFAAVIFAAAIGGSTFYFTRPSSAEREGKEETDGPGLAYEWRRLGMLSEDGTIDPGAWDRAREQIAALAARSTTRGTEGWREAGPFNVAGRTRSVLIDPRNTQVVYTGSVGGGVWKTTDGGVTWRSLSDRLPNMSIGCMVFQPGNPDIIYAGTGEGYFNSDALGGSGILKSTNAGETWSLIPSTNGFSAITRIAISPTDGNRILVTLGQGGVRLSTDGGASWTVTKSAQRGHQVLFHPTDGMKALLTVQDYNFDTSEWFSQAYYSTTGGATWIEATGIKSIGYGNRFEVAYAPSNPSIVYASTANGDSRVYRSADGGASYVAKGAIGPNESQFWYDNAVWVDPTNSSRLVVAGTYPYRSSDSGATWTKIGDGYILTEQPHPDVHAVVGDPGYDGVNNKTVYVCTDGGVFKTTNILTASSSSGWSRFSRDVRTAQFYSAIGDAPTGRYIAGAQDNGTLQMDGNNTDGDWAWGGDGGWCAMDPANANVFYGEYVYLRIFRTTNGGGNADYIYSGITDIDGHANFISPFILDPNSSSRMLAGGHSLWRSNNVTAAIPTWTAIKPSIGSSISAIAVAPGNSNVIWVGHNNGMVYKTTNGTATTPTWTIVDDNSASLNPLPNRYVHRILIDNANSSKVYVAFGGFASNNLWLTTTGGTSFIQRTGTGANILPSAPIRALARHPSDANLLYAGTEVGVCQSIDGGANWSAPSTGPLNVSVDELRFMNNSTKLLAATHGRGLWLLGPVGLSSLSGPSTVPAGGTAQVTVSLDGIAGTGGVDVALSSSSSYLTVPASVVVNGGQKSATFQVTAGSPPAATAATITATLNGTTRNLIITVQAQAAGGPSLTSVTVSPTTVSGGSTTIPKVAVNLSAAAPAGGTVVALASSSPTACSVPLTATVPEGKTFVKVDATTSVVATSQTVTITGTLAGVPQTATLTVTPPRPRSVVLSPKNVYGGSATAVTATLTMDAPAPSSGMTVDLSSSTAAYASVPATASLSAGQTVVTFPVTHYPVNADKAPIIRATSSGLTKQDTLTV
ncbi:MAG: hypothetical protein ACAH95_12625, partial [Fimbriimonas sp.]